jgi:hypothetical protein
MTAIRWLTRASRSRVAILTGVVLAFACRDATAPGQNAFPDPKSLHALAAGTSWTIVSTEDMHGWTFVNDQNNTVCTDATACRLVDGPNVSPLRSGSAELATGTTTDGKALIVAAFGGTRLDSITALNYATYRQSADDANNLAIALQFNVDYDLTDQSTGYQGRLVFEPYQAAPGTVRQGEWQTWDALLGKWWGSKAVVYRNGVAVTNPCQQATPCSWNTLLTQFPNAGIHATYGAIVLKAGSGWPAFRGNVDALTIATPGASVTYDFEVSAPMVPALPPDSIPAWVYADSNWVDGGTVIAGNVAKNVVMVAFAPGASVSDRTNAISRVGGTVVGGLRMSEEFEGVYYVRLAAGSTPAEIIAARDTLSTLEQVGMAIPIVNDTIAGTYLRPIDGPSASSWQVDTAKADGANWALESIAAPLAWGCSTGNSSTRVAVTDEGFHNIEDLRPNILGLTSYVSPFDSSDHGTSVASVIGAKGNNNRGITGIMWDAGLQLWAYDNFAGRAIGLYARDGFFQALLSMAQAVGSDARVINVSTGLYFPSQVSNTRDIPDTPAGHAYLEKRVRPALKWLLRLRNGRPDAPLFVFSAGNGDYRHIGRDASLNGFPIIAQDFPSRVLVVGASDKLASHNHLASFSNHGALVGIAAPGVDVLALDRLGQEVSVNGTSFAAPLVAGVAGLLLSFDPALSVNEVRDFIVGGALLGRQSTDGIPYLNAYESLKLAAQRAGAPLCGNRVYKVGNSIIAERGTATETIISLPNQTADSVNADIDVYHGGKRIDIGFSREFVWSPGSRRFEEQSPYRGASELDGGTFLSGTGQDHDYNNGMSSVSGGALLQFYSSAGMQAFPVPVSPNVPFADTIVVYETPRYGTTVVPNGNSSRDSVIFSGFYDISSKYPSGNATIRDVLSPVALSPRSEYALSIVNVVSQTNSLGSFFDCFGGGVDVEGAIVPPAHCRTGTLQSVADHAEIWRVDLATGSAVLLKTLPGVEVEWLAIGETESEIVWQTATHTTAAQVQFPNPVFTSVPYETLSQTASCTNRKLEYLPFDSKSTTSGAIGATPTRTIAPGDGCYLLNTELGGTIAPSRVGPMPMFRP